MSEQTKKADASVRAWLERSPEELASDLAAWSTERIGYFTSAPSLKEGEQDEENAVIAFGGDDVDPDQLASALALLHAGPFESMPEDLVTKIGLFGLELAQRYGAIELEGQN